MRQTVALSGIDICIIVLYLAALVGLGLYFARKRRIQTAQDLFLGGRSLKWYHVGLSIFSSNVSPVMLVGYGGMAYTTGMVAANFDWLAWWFLLLLAMVFIPHYFATKVSTMPEFLLRRYGQRSFTFLTYYSMISTLIVSVSFVLLTGGLVIAQILEVPFWVAAAGATVLATSYTATGGLAAIAKTGALQSVVVTVAAIIVGVIAINRIGGVSEVISRSPKEFWTIFRPASDPVYPWHAVILGYPVVGIWYWCTDQTIVQQTLAAQNIEQGQYGTMLVAGLKALVPFIFLLPGIYCLILFPNLANPDHAYLVMTANLLPVGLVGITLAALIAALIYDVAIGINAFSTVFSLNVYSKNINPGASPARARLVGRIVIIGSSLIALLMSLLLSTVDKGLFDLSQAVGTYLAPPLTTVFLLGVVWKKATSKAANLTLHFGSALCLCVGIMQIADFPHKAFWPHFMLLTFFLTAILTVFMVVISLLFPETGPGPSLPTLAQTYASQPPYDRRKIWFGWTAIGMLMAVLYYLFG
ncbi:sodium:solute symporter family transporter [Dyadobacter pollutisoli]|uniref:Sodium/solute symporter n=1 Tax=Dyadobacter pollutisoli TaxID=2910158 RepID=A0A9E8ND77_9BACT|nr:sodium/solute symporter [Dyadobacter pollutisoli]WAC13153.1 sodium/solute symporter [Dyadobacter pollutisoli]